MAKMGKEEIEKFLAGEISSSLNYIDSQVASRREQILRYIQLDMYDLPVQRGHSSVVDGTVGNQISMMMPGLMRIMTGGPTIGEYAARGDEDEEFAKVATEYVNQVVMKEDNNGELIIYNWGYDALTQILGVCKGYWEEDIEENDETYENMSDDEFARLFMGVQADPTLSIEAHDFNEEGGHSVTVRKTTNRSRIRIDNIPPEEFVISASARDLESAVLRSHRTYERAGDLREKYGDKIDELPTYDPFHIHQERLIRGQVWDWANNDETDPDMREIAVHEGIVRCNYDGKGIKEWYFVAAGNNEITELLEIEPYDDQIQFYDFCPQPLPHTVIGRCPGDDLVQLQKIKTAVLRQTVNNLNQANAPQRLVYNNGLAKGGLEALINRVPGGIVLANSAFTTGSAPVQELATPFFAQHSFPMLTYFDEEAEKRTGVSRSAMGLDPDTLQRQTATQAAISQSAAMGKIEMIARIWAVGGMRKMFRGILKILKKYQDFPRRVKMRGEIVSVDPRMWPADDWDCTINTGLGTGSKDRDMAVAGLLTQKIEQLIMQAGPNNPIAGLGHLAHAYRQLAHLSGVQNADSWFNDIPTDFQPPPPPQQQDPKMMEVQARIQEAQMRLQMDRQKAVADAQLQRDIAIHKAELEKAVAQAKSDNEAEKIRTQMALEVEKMEREHALKVAELELEADLELIAIKEKAASGQGIIPDNAT